MNSSDQNNFEDEHIWWSENYEDEELAKRWENGFDNLDSGDWNQVTNLGEPTDSTDSTTSEELNLDHLDANFESLWIDRWKEAYTVFSSIRYFSDPLYMGSVIRGGETLRRFLRPEALNKLGQIFQWLIDSNLLQERQKGCLVTPIGEIVRLEDGVCLDLNTWLVYEGFVDGLVLDQYRILHREIDKTFYIEMHRQDKQAFEAPFWLREPEFEDPPQAAADDSPPIDGDNIPF